MCTHCHHQVIMSNIQNMPEKQQLLHYNYASDNQKLKQASRLTWAGSSRKIIICPIAIAYSMGQIIKSVCVCVCVCVCLSVCPSASTLTVAFLDRFSPKLAQT